MTTCTIPMLRFSALLASCAVALPVNGPTQTLDRQTQPLLVLSQRSHLGQGAALSGDGATLVHVGADRALHVLDVASRMDRLLLEEVAPSLDVFYAPCFSPDGTHIAFSVDGGTQSYRSDIYSIATDGTDLRQLTASTHTLIEGKPAEYFHTPMYSQNGSQILVWHSERTEQDVQVDSADLISSDGSKRLLVTSGRPLGWSATGRSIFVARDNHVFTVDLATGRALPVPGLSLPLFGRVPTTDIFLVADGSKVGFADVRNAVAGAPMPSEIPVRKRRDGSPAQGRLDDLKLLAVHVDKARDRIVLHYKSEIGLDEIFEVWNVQGFGR